MTLTRALSRTLAVLFSLALIAGLAPTPDGGHGTHVAGIIGGNSWSSSSWTSGAATVAPRASLDYP